MKAIDILRPGIGLLGALVWLAGVILAAAAGERLLDPRIFTNSAGQTMPYRLLRPDNPEPARKYPLVLFFHGAGERGTDNEKQLVHGVSRFLQPESRSQYPCYLAAPQCPNGQQWVDMPWGTDSGTRPAQPSAAMKLALEILEALIAEGQVDADRLYVTGLSMGGYASWDCVTRFPERFAAGIPICGGGDETTVNEKVAKVPVWAFHSEDDGTVKVRRTRGMIEAMKKAGGQPKYFEYFGLEHNSWSTAYAEPELLSWLFAQRRGQMDSYVLKTPAPELPASARWPQSDDLFPGQGPLQKAGWFQQLWRARRVRWHNTREQDQGAVVFLGDSITHGWTALPREFPRLKTANRGISGDTTRGVRYRLKDDVLAVHPAAVVMLIGTNDLGLGGEPEPAAENIRIILQELKAANPRMPVILCRVMPRALEPGRFPEKIQKLNQLLEQAVQGDPQITWCDTWTLFADEQGAAKKEEFPDLLHPNAAGYAKWAGELRPIFARLGLEKP